jgi:hypothetical protein
MFSDADSRVMPELQRSCNHLLHGPWLDVRHPIPPLPELRPDIEKRFGESGFV